MMKAIIGLLLSAFLLGTAGCQTNTGNTSSATESADATTAIYENVDDDHLTLQIEEDQNEGIAFLPLGVYMRPVSYEAGQLEVVIDNQSGADYYYGKDYMLQKKDGENWIDVEPVEDYGWPKISLMVKDTETATESYDLTVFGNLTAGTYKLVKNDLETEFTLVEASE